MKTSLLSIFGAVVLLYQCNVNPAEAQTVSFSENFSGFSTGTHATPSTSDASSNLDSRTQAAGWSGSKVYSAGGEIKLGTSDATGWIETPLITFPGSNEVTVLKFDICRWTGDAATVRILLNGSQLGNTLTPADNFQTVQLTIPSGPSSGRIKFEGVTKRFFLDNVSVTSQIVNSIMDEDYQDKSVFIFPNPAGDQLTVCNAGGYDLFEISDLSGRRVLSGILMGKEYETIFLSGLKPGIYFLYLRSSNKYSLIRFIKLP